MLPRGGALRARGVAGLGFCDAEATPRNPTSHSFAHSVARRGCSRRRRPCSGLPCLIAWLLADGTLRIRTGTRVAVEQPQCSKPSSCRAASLAAGDSNKVSTRYSHAVCGSGSGLCCEAAAKTASVYLYVGELWEAALLWLGRRRGLRHPKHHKAAKACDG